MVGRFSVIFTVDIGACDGSGRLHQDVVDLSSPGEGGSVSAGVDSSVRVLQNDWGRLQLAGKVPDGLAVLKPK